MEISDTKEVRKITTLHFGELTIEPQHIFRFDDGLLGFEQLKEFVLISEEETLPFRWLISLESPEIGFPLLSPWYLDQSYDPGRDFDIERQVIFVVITLEDEKGLMTANMKAPVILDVKRQSGIQVILPTDKYSPTYVIQKRDKKQK